MNGIVNHASVDHSLRDTRGGRPWLIPLLGLGLLGACGPKPAEEKPPADGAVQPIEERLGGGHFEAGDEYVDDDDGGFDTGGNHGDPCANKYPNFDSSSIPGPGPGTANGNIPTDLAVFAWQHFVALNWEAADGSGNVAQRGRPVANGSFYDTPKVPVWLSYWHRNEMFPATGTPNADPSARPNYRYANVSGPCTGSDTNPNEFNNLDENSQLGLNYMFAQPSGAPEPIQILFEAKVNPDAFNYVVGNQLYDATWQDQFGKVNSSDLATYGAICQTDTTHCPQSDLRSHPGAGYCLPCGTASQAGAIHVKAAWRKLTASEASSGRFLTAPVTLYEASGTDVCYSNANGETWGLVGLHIMRKTEQFPAFVFMSWEHTDNVNANLAYENTNKGGPSDTVGRKVPWSRVSNDGKTLPSASVSEVNQCVHDKVYSAKTDSVWQYYQLVGVQATPVDYANRSQTEPDYFLANNVIESNQFFQSFNGDHSGYSPTGDGPNGTTLGTNLYYQGHQYNVGGCQGCHGRAQIQGFDSSFLRTPFANKADAIGEFENVSAGAAAFLAMDAK